MSRGPKGVTDITTAPPFSSLPSCPLKVLEGLTLKNRFLWSGGAQRAHLGKAVRFRKMLQRPDTGTGNEGSGFFLSHRANGHENRLWDRLPLRGTISPGDYGQGLGKPCRRPMGGSRDRTLLHHPRTVSIRHPGKKGAGRRTSLP